MTESIHTLIIAPYPEIKPMIDEVLQKYPRIEAETFVGSYEESVQKYPFLLTGEEGSEIELVVARGYTAEQLIRLSHFPVVEIETSLYDTLRSIKLAQQRGCPFAIMGSKAIIATARQLIVVLQLNEVPLIDITNKQMGFDQAVLLKQRGIKLIIGDLFAIDACQKLGIDSIFITSGKASLEQTFLTVERLRVIFTSQTRRCAMFCNALQHSGNAVYIFNEHREQLFANMGHEIIPPQVYECIPKYLSQIYHSETVSIKKRAGGRLYNLAITRFQTNEPYYVVYIHSYEKSNPTGLDEFLHIQNPLETFDGEVMLSSLQQLFPIHPSLRNVQRQSRESIMLYGASGTGKGYLAQMYWRNGVYANNSLITLQCANLTLERWLRLVDQPESVLFDMEYTLLLKNIHKLTPDVQEAINTFLRNTCFNHSHVILCTSDVHLSVLVTQGSFLGDLYRKVAEYEQYLPTLNEKPEFIKPIVDQCITQFNLQYGKEVIGLEEDALDVLQKYEWKNNIEQLLDVMRYLVQNVETHYINTHQIHAALDRFIAIKIPSHPDFLLSGTLAEMEEQLVRIVINETEGSYTDVAKRLGISRTSLWRMLKKS